MCCMYREGDSSISEEMEENLLKASGTSSVINEKHQFLTKSTLILSMNDYNNRTTEVKTFFYWLKQSTEVSN